MHVTDDYMHVMPNMTVACMLYSCDSHVIRTCMLHLIVECMSNIHIHVPCMVHECNMHVDMHTQ